MYNNIGISFPHSLFNPFVPVNVHFHSTLYTPHLCQKKKKKPDNCADCQCPSANSKHRPNYGNCIPDTHTSLTA